MHNDAFQITLSMQWSAKRYPHLQWYNFMPDMDNIGLDSPTFKRLAESIRNSVVFQPHRQFNH